MTMKFYYCASCTFHNLQYVFLHLHPNLINSLPSIGWNHDNLTILIISG